MSGAIGDTPTKGGGARFKGMKTLSKGAHGMVQLAADQTSDNRCVVIKYVLRGEAVSSRPVLREVLNHQEISMYKHPHFVEFYELFLTPRYLGIVMEYVDGRNLEAYLLEHGGKLPEDAARFLFQQLMVAVEFLHKRRKINLDIKLSSVLITEQGPLPVLKLFHFGLSKDMINDTAPDTRTGTALFSAPEVFLHADGQSYDGVPVDIWSCGVILHIMLFGCHPFLYPSDLELNQGEQVVKLIENVLGGRLQLPDEAVGTPLGNLLRRMLDPEPKQRATIAEIFQDAWFQVEPVVGIKMHCFRYNFML
ncbi:hypothetical protein CEUSTIGMA_g7043.t1 [Chlamydomonas eustigma]|uniref:Protein kinase domain-containing protein n=1 Tax=Chlamydomonas eustigma TaxID=1157962 RepID=A0A250X9R5_9CHLO|nr:hypothetical protein CEUSTIGMA_g7043.t1 [Chlamydomonas eustigma]|eukprot:GAX79602.1 hypothetical protein CEUSTIGMA_g7043.t1 [Chlamydomonas eustigma]